MSTPCPRCNGRGSVELTHENLVEAIGGFDAALMHDCHDELLLQSRGCRLKCPVCHPIEARGVDENIARLYR